MPESIDLDLYPSSDEQKPSKKALGKRKAPAHQSSQDGKGFESETDSEEEKPVSKMAQLRAQAAANKAAPRFVSPLPTAGSSRPVKKEVIDVDRPLPSKGRDNPFLNGGRSSMNKPALNGLNKSALNGGKQHLNGAASGKAATLVPDATLPVPLTVAETKCRGAEKYPGRNLVQPGVKMTFHREPSNAWDPNAIQIKIGQSMCGYIPKGVAGKLAPFIDTQRLTMTVAAGDISNHKARGSTDIPIKLSIYGSRTLMMESDLAWAFNQSSDVKPNPALADPSTGITPKMEEEPQAQNAIQEEMERTRTVAVRADTILSSLFAENSVDVALLPVCDQPTRMRPTTVLLKHQLQGLRWMIEMEHPKLPETEQDPPVQLWTKVGGKDGLDRYCNVATKMSVLEGDTPKLHRGGILSDDMGLGKTITTLALIRSPNSGEGVINPAEEEPEDPKRRYSDTTLIVCPLSVIGNWRDQIRMHVGGANECNYHVYHGSGAKVSNSFLRNCDVVITTYQTLANEYIVDKDGELVRKKAKKPKKHKKLENGTLYKVKWRRVVLDEGHIIRNRKTQAFKAAKAIYAERRWILTGTPLINHTKDLGAMLGFTRVCRPLDNAVEWSQYVDTPVKKGREEGSAVLRAVVQSCTLRRTKEMEDSDGNRIVPLPTVSHHVYKVKLDDDIRKLYDTALSAVQERVKGMMERNEHLTQYTNILTYLLRLRQLACAPSLVPEEFLQVARNAARLGEEDAEPEPTLTADQLIKLRRKLLEMSNEECPICFEPTMEEPRILPCTHVMCFACMEEIVQKDPLCPMCRKQFKLKDAIDLPPNMDETQYGEVTSQHTDCYASKAKELVRLIKITGKQRSLVFSQWTSHLQHLEDTLDDEGITYARYDGKMTMSERDAVIENFKSPKGPQILMLSLACGALGLNLTVAENVFLLDPWWQAAIEQQAIDRVNRIGQTKPVRVFQLIAEDTIEDRVLGIQQRKQKMIEAAFSGTRGAYFERNKTESKFGDIAEALGLAS